MCKPNCQHRKDDPRPFFTHDCTPENGCHYLGSATVMGRDLDFYVHEPAPPWHSIPSLIYRTGNSIGDYGSCPADYVSALSLESMMALGLYLRFKKANGANGSFVRGRFFHNSQEIINLGTL